MPRRSAWPGLLAGLVAAHAAADLARLEADERPHAPQFHVVLVEQLEVDGVSTGTRKWALPSASTGTSPSTRTGFQLIITDLTSGS